MAQQYSNYHHYLVEAATAILSHDQYRYVSEKKECDKAEKYEKDAKEGEEGEDEEEDEKAAKLPFPVKESYFANLIGVLAEGEYIVTKEDLLALAEAALAMIEEGEGYTPDADAKARIKDYYTRKEPKKEKLSGSREGRNLMFGKETPKTHWETYK